MILPLIATTSFLLGYYLRHLISPRKKPVQTIEEATGKSREFVEME